MPRMVNNRLVLLAVVAILAAQISWAGDRVRITLPRRTRFTPVQRLNRDGVEAIKKHDYERAGVLFNRAYLYDPTDPFTLNNLGYIAELQGQMDSARRFYDLASKQSSNADIDRTNAKGLEGKPMRAALDGLENVPMRVNRMNMDAMRLLRENRGFEATGVLRAALALDPQNPFTLNNLGVAHEAIGDYGTALKFYGQAADEHSTEPVVVTLNEQWRGRPVSRMAAESEKRLQKRMRDMSPAEAQSVMFTMRGVAAANQNDWASARQNFIKAYSLNPGSAFSLNNRGYVAERDGDLETAQFFYEKARRADDSHARVGLATERLAEGQDLLSVASDSNQKVDDALEQYSQQRRREKGPIELTPRGAAAQQPESKPAPKAPPAQSPLAPH
jgi:Flp pilus assembly protein TadD